MATINATESPFELRGNGEATNSMTRPSYFAVEMGFQESFEDETPPSSAEAVMEALEVMGLGEDQEFQVASEWFAAEAPESHETLQEWLPEDHFAPMASQEWPSDEHFTSVASESEAEALPERFFESHCEVEMGTQASSPDEASPSAAEAMMEVLEAEGHGEDHEFQVAPEWLAPEAPESHETLQERLPEDHFAPMASQEWPSDDHFTSVASEAEASLERFFESYFEVEMGFQESFEDEASPSPAEAVMEALEVEGLGEDHEYQVAPEGLAAEAPETHETLQEWLPEDHFASMASQDWPSEDHFTSVAFEAEALLERFFERIQDYEGEALTEAEIERVIAEITPQHDPFAPASEQFLGKLIRSAGKFVSRTVNSVAHAVADVSSSVADTLGKVPIIGSGLKGLYGYTYGALIQAADNVVSGVRLDKVASRYLESQVQNVRQLAPYVQSVIALVPGVGPGVSGAISAGLSLAQGRSIDQALVDAAVGALPGGALVQSTAKMTYAAISGKPISDIAVAALPLSPAAKEGLKAGLRVTSDLAQGKRVDNTLLAEANRQVERLPPQFRTAAQVGIALGQGKRLQDVAATQLPRLIAVGGPLAAAGQKIASQSPVVQRARRLLVREGQHGFDVAQGLMAQTGARLHQLERARATLRGEALKGFERAVALHGGYALPKARVVPLSRRVKRAPGPAPARIRTIGRASSTSASGISAPGAFAPTPLTRGPEVVAAVDPLPASSVPDSEPAVTLDEPASMSSDEPTANPTSDVPTSSAATCPSCGAPQVTDTAYSDSEPIGDVSLASTPTVDELETPFELSWMTEPPASVMHQPDSLSRSGSSELGEVASPTHPRLALEYVRWVQGALNHTLGTKLTVDGRSGPATRSAVAQFQRGHKLNPDGVVGPATESALAAASGSPAPAIATNTGSSTVSRASYARWSDSDDRRKGRNPRDQDVAAADPQGSSMVLEFPVPGDRNQRNFLLQNFKIDGASLRLEHKQYLEGLARWMRSGRPRGWQIFAEAHASRTGTERHDDLLSKDRYLVTRAFLESQLLRAGFDAARLRVYGEGVGFRHSPLPGEDPRARSVYVVVQPDPSPSPPTSWPPPIVPVVWPPPPPVSTCLLRVPGEKQASFFVTPRVTFFPANRQLLVQGFAVGSKKVTFDMSQTAAWQKAMSFMAGDPNVKVAVRGFTDCAGSDAENFTLQAQRADAGKAAMPTVVQSRVLATGPAGTAAFLAGNATVAERALNRAVEVNFTSVPPPSQRPFDRLVNGVTTLDEYLFLVRSLEQRLGLTAPADTPKVLSVLRQIYYGSAPWTKANGRTRVWDKLITSPPWSPGDDPTPQLTQPLMQALQNSQVVKGTDLGHVFTGLDAMMNPNVIAPTSLINEEVATWSGDLGSAAAWWAVDISYGRTVPKSKGQPVGTPDHYFGAFASESDLLGDIDAFAMRAGFSPASPPLSLLMQKVQLSGPLSEALMQYYLIARSNLGKARNRRFTIFLESYGGVVQGASLTNPSAVIAVLQPKITNFAAPFALMDPLPKHTKEYGDRTVPPGDPRLLNELLIDGSAKMTNRFINFLVRTPHLS